MPLSLRVYSRLFITMSNKISDNGLSCLNLLGFLKGGGGSPLKHHVEGSRGYAILDNFVKHG